VRSCTRIFPNHSGRGGNLRPLRDIHTAENVSRKFDWLFEGSDDVAQGMDEWSSLGCWGFNSSKAVLTCSERQGSRRSMPNPRDPQAPGRSRAGLQASPARFRPPGQGFLGLVNRKASAVRSRGVLAAQVGSTCPLARAGDGSCWKERATSCI
jgi:hypothetical protein